MLTGRRYRLCLTAEQAEMAEEFGNICRSVWNTALEQRREYRRRGAWMNYVPQAAELADAKREHEWLRAAPSARSPADPEGPRQGMPDPRHVQGPLALQGPLEPLVQVPSWEPHHSRAAEPQVGPREAAQAGLGRLPLGPATRVARSGPPLFHARPGTGTSPSSSRTESSPPSTTRARLSASTGALSSRRPRAPATSMSESSPPAGRRPDTGAFSSASPARGRARRTVARPWRR